MVACSDSGVPTPAALSPVGELALSGVVGEVLPSPLTVKVADSGGNPIAGVAVTFAVADGAGSLSRAADTTDFAGLASTSWRLGDRTVAQRVTATVTGITSVNFVATARAAAPATIAVEGGDNQSGLSSAALTTAPSVVVRDRFTNPVPNVTVTFTVAAGGGTVTNASGNTNASGVATSGGWRLGAGTGTNRLTALAIASGITNNPITFTAIATAGAPASVVAQTPTANLSGTVGLLLTPVPSVRVLDAGGNPVQGTSVTFTASTGSTVVGGSKLTDANGVAAPDGWQLGAVAQNYTLTAAAGSLTPVTFTASARAAAAASVAISAGNNQIGPVGRPVATEPAVRVTDGLGNPVAGAEVNFAVVSGNGAATGRRALTGSDGIAAVGGWTLGDAVGSNTLRATVTGDNISGNPVLFTATGTAGTAATLAPAGGNAQSGQVATALATSPSVTVRDARGNPVAGVTVTFTPGPLSGSVTGGTATSNASGVAAVTTWTLGTVAGTQTLIARSAGLPDVVFTAVATAGPATVIASNGVPTQQVAVVGTSVTPAPSVRVFDAQGNGVSGVSVAFASSTGSTVTGGAKLTDNNGVAAPDGWTLGTQARTYTLTATTGSLSSVTFSVAARAGAAAAATISDGNNQSATVGTTLPIDPAVRVVDQFGNPVGGIEVVFDVTAGGGTAIARRPVTNADGVATVGGWTLGRLAGTNNNTLRATVAGSGITGNPLTFSASGTAGVATGLAVSSGNNQSATVATQLPQNPTVIVRDAQNNPVPGVVVTFTAGTNSGAVSSTSTGTTAATATATTDVNGTASVFWTLGSLAGAQTLVASADGLSSATFTATGTAGAAASIAVLSGNGQTAPVNTNVGTVPVVQVRDALNNPVAGATVVFSTTNPGGTVTDASVTSAANGQASPTSWTLGTVAGAQTLTVTAGAVSITISATATVGAAAAATSTLAIGSATLSINTGSTVTITVRDAFGNVRTQATTADFVAAASAGTLGAFTCVSGVCTATYTAPGAATSVNLTATISATAISGSPLVVTVIP